MATFSLVPIELVAEKVSRTAEGRKKQAAGCMILAL
jgi:hypothetical protein